MRTDKIRKRLADKIKEKGLTMKDLSLLLSRHPGFISDFLKGKQKTLLDDDIVTLAKALGVSELWLLGHAEDMKPISLEAGHSNGSAFKDIASVGDAEEIRVNLTHLDILTGRCGLVENGLTLSGIIVDPAFAVRGNIYERAFIGRDKIKVLCKLVSNTAGATIYYVLNAANT